jgi:hypothetical protein
LADPFREGAYQSKYKKMPEEPRLDVGEPTTPTSGAFEERTPASPSSSRSIFGFLPSNEAFTNIGGIGFFASNPPTPKSRSRSSSAGGALASSSTFKMTSLDSDEVSKRIRGAMRERGRNRTLENEGAETETESSFDMADDARMTPTTEDEESKKER